MSSALVLVLALSLCLFLCDLLDEEGRLGERGTSLEQTVCAMLLEGSEEADEPETGTGALAAAGTDGTSCGLQLVSGTED